MSKLVLDVDISEIIKNNYVIRYNEKKKCWEAVSYLVFNDALYGECNKLRQENAKLKEELNVFKANVNKKLKEHHDALKILTGGH